MRSNRSTSITEGVVASDDTLNDFLENGALSLHRVGADGKILWANRAELELFGYEESEYVGRNIAEFHADRDVIEDILRRLHAGETIRNRPARMRAKDGSIKDVLIHSSVRFEDGRFLYTRCFTQDVTAAKQAEDAWRRSHEQLEVVLHGVSDGITAIDATGAMLFANDAAAHLCGYPDAAALKNAPRGEIFERLELRDEEGKPFPLERLPTRIALSGAAPPKDTVVCWRERATGRERWSVLNSSAVRDERGRVQLVITIFRDMTDRLRALERDRVIARATAVLAEGGPELETVQRVADIVVPGLADWCTIHVPDDDGELRRAVAHRDPQKRAWAEEMHRRWPPDPDAPRGAYAVMRTGQRELMREIPDELLVDASARHGSEYLDLVRKIGMKSYVSVPLRAKTGTLGVLSFVSAEGDRRYDDGDLALAQDLADRVATFLERARLHHRAEEARRVAETHAARARLLADASRMFAEANTDLDAVLDVVVRKIVEIVGGGCSVRTLSDDGVLNVHRATWLEDPGARAAALHPAMTAPRPAALGYFGEVLRTGRPVVVHHVDAAELAAQYAAAGISHLLEVLTPNCVASMPLRAAGRTFGVLTVARYDGQQSYDDSELLLLEELADRAALAIENARLHASQRAAIASRDETLAVLAETMRFSEVFVGMLGHDLRNPLSAITTSAKLLFKRGGSDERFSVPATRIQSSAARMARMIDQLLDFTRARVGGGIPLDKQPLDLRELVATIVDELNVGEGPARLVVEARGDTVGVWDGDRLSQVISNLAGNALEHGTPGERVQVVVDGTRAEAVVVEITNAGTLPDEVAPIIFEPFRHAKFRRRGASGLGLGLYISHQVALAHGGTLTSACRDARTTFRLELPRA